MHTLLPPSPKRSRRRFGLPRFSEDPDKRSIQVGVLATILIHVLLVLLLPKSLRPDLTGLHPAQKSHPPQFNIELAPDTFRPPNPPPPPFKFVETNPDAPDNAPDKTNNFGAQNQQVAQEKPTPDQKNDRPATEGEKDLASTQIVTGHLTEQNQPHDSAPPVETPPTTPAVAPAKREQNPLPGVEKVEEQGRIEFWQQHREVFRECRSRAGKSRRHQKRPADPGSHVGHRADRSQKAPASQGDRAQCPARHPRRK